MKLSYALYNHFTSLKVFEAIKQANKTPIILTEAQQVLMENGIAVAKLLKSIFSLKQEIAQRTLTPLPQLDQLKQITTASTKLYNWNIIIAAMNQLQIPHEVNNDMKKLILMGDVQIIEETVNSLYDFYLKLSQARLSKPKGSPNVRNRILSEQQPPTLAYSHLNLSQQQEDTQISDSNTLEYFTQLLSKWLNLQYKQVVSLYADNFKFWAQIVTKGVQRVFEPILGVYKDVFSSVEHLQNLIAMEKDKALKFSLNLLKPGLVSKSPEVCIETIKTLGNFVLKAYGQKISYQDDIYYWYVESCFQTTLLSIKRHPQLVDSLVDLMILFCKNHLVDFFTSTLKQHSATSVEMLVNVEKLFSSLTPEYLLELSSMGIMQQWLEQALEILESTQQLKSDEKICILRLVSNIWLKQWNQFQSYQERVHNSLRAGTLDQRECVALFSVQFLFLMLEQFGKSKVPEAPIIYKIIAIQLIEVSNQDVVHFILQNLLLTFQHIPQIPFAVVLDPFIVHLSEKTYPSLAVFGFLSTIASNPNLTTKLQIQLMDLVSKIAIYDTMHYRIAQQIFMTLITNTQNVLSTQEFVQKFVKISLAVYFSVHRQSEKKKPTQQTTDKQRKAQIIEILKSIVQLKNQNMNAVIKTMAGHTYLQFKLISKPNKGLHVLLSLLGDVNEIMQQVEQEYNETQTNKQAYSDSSVKEVQQVQGNLKKFSKIRLTKEEQYHLASLRMSKEADPKVLNDIFTIKKQFNDKLVEKQTQQQYQEDQLKSKKDKLRKQLEKRQIEQGIASLNQKDVAVKLLYPDGSRQTELAKEKKHGLIIFELIDLNNEEDIDKLLVDQMLKKYHKVFRFIFSKYANTCLQGMKQPNSFEQYQQRTESINVAEISKFVHEYEIAIPVENVQALARQVGTQILKNKNEFREFDFQGFTQFIIQLSIVLSKTKVPDVSPYQCLNKFLQYLRNIVASKGQSTALFDDPESQYFMENDIIKEYNLQLLSNPNYDLPQGYKKVATQEIQFTYDMPFLEESTSVPYLILDDILFKALGIHIIEPISNKLVVYKAKPDAFGYIQSKLQEQPADDQYKIQPKKSKDVNVSLQKKKVLEIEPKRELSLNMKLAIAACNLKDKYIAENVANLLDDMLFAIEHNKQSAVRQNQIINKVQEDKKQQQLDQEQQEMKREQIRKQREKELKDRLKEERERQKQLQEQMEKERYEKNKTEHQIKKELEDKRISYLTEQKQKLQVKSEKEKEEQLRKMLEEKERKEKDIKQKKHHFQEFNQKQIAKLKQIITSGQKQKSESDKEKADRLKRQQLLLQQARSKILTQDHSRLQEQQNLEKEILNKFKSEQYQKVIEKHQFGLSYLFQFLIKETFLPIGKPASREQISYKTFAWFADRFNLCPEIVQKDDILQLFRYLTKDKEMIDGVPIGMNYDEFLQALHRISIKGSKIFNKVGKMDVKSIQRIVEAEQVIDLEARSQSPRAESIVIETPLRNKSKSNYLESSKMLKELVVFCQQSTVQTFEALILYMDISNDKNQLDNRFRKTLEEKKVPTKMRRKILSEKLGIKE